MTDKHMQIKQKLEEEKLQKLGIQKSVQEVVKAPIDYKKDMAKFYDVNQAETRDIDLR